MASYEIDRIQFGDNVYRLKDTFREYLEETETPEEASGNPAVIDRPWPTVIDSLAVAIRPKRDLHGFSVPWAGGAGKNLFKGPDGAFVHRNVTMTPNVDGSVTISGSANSTPFMYYWVLPKPIPSGTTVTISLNNSEINADVGVRLISTTDGDTGTSWGSSATANSVNRTRTVTLAWDAPAVNVYVASNHGDVPEITLKIQVEVGGEATDWTPWENRCPIGGFGTVEITRSGQEDAEEPDEAYEVELPGEAGTVYGGTLTLNADGSGTLTVDRAVLRVGGMTWTDNANYDRFQSSLPGILRGPVRGVYIMSSVFTPCDDQRAIGSVEPGMIYSAGTNSDNCYVKKIGGESVSQFAERFADETICYILATPAVYSLTAPQVRTAAGYNALASDAGDITVQFRADRLAGAAATAAATAAETMAVIEEYGAS